jgi:hypothetical protein
MRLPARLTSDALALALVAAACGDDGAGGPAPTSSPSAPDPTTTVAAPTASFRGVTEDTIRVGVMAVDYEALASIGVVGSADVSEVEYRTIVEAFGEAGYDVVEGLIGANADDLTETRRDQFLIYERLTEEAVDVTVSTTGIPLEFVNAIEAGYETDQWFLTAIISPESLRDAGVDRDYHDGALGVVNTAVGTSGQPTMGDDPEVADCVDDLAARTGRELTYALDVEVNDLVTALYACAMADILEAGLDGAGTNLTNDTFRAGLEAVGPIDLAGYTDSRLEPGDLGAARGLALVRFDAEAEVWELLD